MKIFKFLWSVHLNPPNICWKEGAKNSLTLFNGNESTFKVNVCTCLPSVSNQFKGGGMISFSWHQMICRPILVSLQNGSMSLYWCSTTTIARAKDFLLLQMKPFDGNLFYVCLLSIVMRWKYALTPHYWVVPYYCMGFIYCRSSAFQARFQTMFAFT